MVPALAECPPPPPWALLGPRTDSLPSPASPGGAWLTQTPLPLHSMNREPSLSQDPEGVRNVGQRAGRPAGGQGARTTPLTTPLSQTCLLPTPGADLTSLLLPAPAGTSGPQFLLCKVGTFTSAPLSP